MGKEGPHFDLGQACAQLIYHIEMKVHTPQACYLLTSLRHQHLPATQSFLRGIGIMGGNNEPQINKQQVRMWDPWPWLHLR